MLQWIEKLFGQKEVEPRCVQALAKEGVRMRVFEYVLPCGHLGYGIELSCNVGACNQWIDVAVLRDFNLSTATDLLLEAQGFILNATKDQPKFANLLEHEDACGALE